MVLLQKLVSLRKLLSYLFLYIFRLLGPLLDRRVDLGFGLKFTSAVARVTDLKLARVFLLNFAVIFRDRHCFVNLETLAGSDGLLSKNSTCS